MSEWKIEPAQSAPQAHAEAVSAKAYAKIARRKADKAAQWATFAVMMASVSFAASLVALVYAR